MKIFSTALASILVSTAFAEPVPSPTPTPTRMKKIISEKLKTELPSPELETLPNGLRVAWFLDDKLPVVDIAFLVLSGQRDDPQGKSGVAELTASLLERGSGGFAPAEIARRIESLGASAYADTEDDATSVGIHGLSEDTSKLLDLLGLMLLRPNFQAAEFQREKQMLEEYWGHLGDSADSLATFVYTRMILNGTSYARGGLQGLKQLRGISLKDVKGWYAKHFTPKNSILAVVGRVDRAEFRKQLLERFGDWKGEAPKREWKPYRDPRFGRNEATIYVVDRKDLPQAQVRIGFPIPGIQSPKRYALAVANSLMGEYFGSRLNVTIRDELGLAYGVDSSLNYARDHAYLTVRSATRSENAGRLVIEALRILDSIKVGGISETEVDTAREYLMGSFPLTVSTLGSVATRWLSGTVYGLGPQFLNEYIPRVRAVSHREVVSAVDEGFQLEKRVIVIAGDAKAITTSLIASGFKDMKTLDPAKLLKD